MEVITRRNNQEAKGVELARADMEQGTGFLLLQAFVIYLILHVQEVVIT
jgi:hypothetical protein